MAAHTFPLASWPEVRREVVRQIKAVPHAARNSVFAVFLLGIGAAMGVAVPQLMGRIVDVVREGQAASGGSPTQDLLLLSVVLAVAAVCGGACNALGFYTIATVSERVIANLRESMITTTLNLPVHEVESAGTGDIVSRATDDVQEVSKAVTESLPQLSVGVFALVATAVSMVALDWHYLLTIVLVLPVYVLAARAYLAHAPKRFAAERAAMGQRARRVLEAIRGKATLDAFGMSAATHGQIFQASWNAVLLGVRARLSMLVLNLQTVIAEWLLLSAALLMSFWLVSQGQITLGAATASVLLVIRVRNPIMQLMRVLDSLQSAYASLARIVGVSLNPPVAVPDSGALAPRGEVRLDNVSFAYGEGMWAVKDINLHIPAGHTLAMVGASGAGKTTVAALIAGLRLPDAGSVSIDGVEVARLSDAERRSRLALVSQEVYIFSGTLREDLLLAKPDATDEELIQAITRAQALAWFEHLPDGLDTQVGAQGLPIEPVVAQQLALARILLMDPAVVVMDEATAEAGSAGAGTLDVAAAEVTEGRTALTVAHRLDQARRADKVVVMDAGRIIEQGTHEELIALGGRYEQLWSAWSAGREQ
ncbi:ABC transporter ATP-binding protein/permease [Corynebacterium sp. 153RC1]|uniref:ABC transporter ATP-binding protein n=1 Tax=unclassified Corynebacterium TaxID=2624378 RepID=UPI00211CF392|nr:MULTISPECIES: ABC transporter ATP-binding protein [unclassified Corynebacterium]MCQ9353418.1 ABC transporter ATP-binding protein/permease [Corynebacterium sp. 209RC1]MCQ9355640.1 ABC transporter ATP-binding protein/permease [Corynebacterium sp. 1222RC1]MCQ9357833.1 ABC transporter ATP-binding protein/permease [Corynebacterium sp. 122RC1]MCQ9360017.1 ABC transporter ATP-binding protein/permease [Corynebacterium sp. 142RC1]MCQ9362161.1 ABC transporter ATP-binding protein/permease [Corynebacte